MILSVQRNKIDLVHFWITKEIDLMLRGALLALAAMGLYCLYDVTIKYLGKAYTPMQILFCAGLFFVPMILAQLIFTDKNQPNKFRPRLPKWMAFRVGVTLINGLFGAYAFSVLPLAECYAIVFLMPLMISLLAVPLLSEPLDLQRGLAILVGLGGVLLALQPGTVSLGLGHAAAFLSAGFGALNYVILRKCGSVERVGVQMLYPALAQFLVAAAFMPLFWVPMTPAHWAFTALMALEVFFGGLLIIAAYRRAPAIIISPMQYSQIIWAALLGWVFFDETITPTTLAGIIVICSAGLFLLFGARKVALVP